MALWCLPTILMPPRLTTQAPRAAWRLPSSARRSRRASRRPRSTTSRPTPTATSTTCLLAPARTPLILRPSAYAPPTPRPSHYAPHPAPLTLRPSHPTPLPPHAPPTLRLSHPRPPGAQRGAHLRLTSRRGDHRQPRLRWPQCRARLQALQGRGQDAPRGGRRSTSCQVLVRRGRAAVEPPLLQGSAGGLPPCLLELAAVTSHARPEESN